MAKMDVHGNTKERLAVILLPVAQTPVVQLKIKQ
jgi:hypothetical protein